MNAVNLSSLKVIACGAAALALTVALSWSFVESTSVARWVTSEAVAQLADSSEAAGRLARVGAAALLD